jgi:hypothetical protein
MSDFNFVGGNGLFRFNNHVSIVFFLRAHNPFNFMFCVRRIVFGGSVGPNPKPLATSGASTEFQFFGIKARASGVPLVSAGPSVTTTTHVASHQQPTTPPAPEAENAPITPATAGDPALNTVSPILKAQLSAPSKPGAKVDSIKSQVRVLAKQSLSQLTVIFAICRPSFYFFVLFYLLS